MMPIFALLLQILFSIVAIIFTVAATELKYDEEPETGIDIGKAIGRARLLAFFFAVFALAVPWFV